VSRAALNKAAEERRRKRELKKCLKSTYYLATKYLNYDRLTDWHETRTDIFDKNRDQRYVLWLAPRGHYKTTLVEAEVCRDILENPDKVHLLTHASAEEVLKNVKGIAWHFTHNDKFRWLMPEIMPPKFDTTFFTQTPSPQFTVKRNKFNKQPTVRGAQAGKEITGSHIDGTIWLDDIVGEKTIKDATGMNDLRDWYRATISNVLMHEVPDSRVRGRGTRWHLNDIWDDFLNSEDWLCMTDACLVDEHGKPDWQGSSVLFSEKVIAEKLRQMGHVTFAMQMMNDPLTEEMKAWREEDETECDFDEVKPGVTMVLSDPAPKGVGSADKTKAKMRGGHGDYWGISVVRFVIHKHLLIRYRLYAIQSNKWTWDEGMDQILDLCEQFGVRKVCIEEGSQNKGMHRDRLYERARKRGFPRPKFIDMKSFNKGKDWRHAGLSALNSSGEWVFVNGLIDEGTAELERQQCRNHPQSRYDDLMDSDSLCVDPAVVAEAPKADKFIPKLINAARKKAKWRKKTRYVY
jgi:hypothetical protein